MTATELLMLGASRLACRRDLEGIFAGTEFLAALERQVTAFSGQLFAAGRVLRVMHDQNIPSRSAAICFNGRIEMVSLDDER